MLLAIDVGNTQTVLGVYQDDELVHMWRLATNKLVTADELGLTILSFLHAEGLECDKIDGGILASVVPALTDAWKFALSDRIGIDPILCSAKTAGSLFKTDYANPGEIGADRVADAVAAQHVCGAPVLVVDFGTATNIEVVDKEGVFRGGIIAPGLETSADALFAHATKLSATELVDPHTAIGRNTTEAIQAGLVYGEVDRIDGLVRRIFKQLGYEATVVATGGLSCRVGDLCETVTTIIPELTLIGLRLIYNENTQV